MNNVLMLIIIALGIRLVGTLLIKAIFSSMYKTHRMHQTNKLRYMQIKIPKSVTTKGSEDGGDTIRDMKQNIQIMNQIYKNFYSIVEDKRSHRKLGNNYISMEMFIEKEVIKFIMGVPEEHMETMEKLISSFLIGAVVDPIDQPKLLEAGKYMAGGEFFLTKDNAYPTKTYEAFEADPMDSILSAYSKVFTDEKMCLQILMAPLDEDALKSLRKDSKKIKEGKNKSFFALLLRDIRKGIISTSNEKDASKDEDTKKSDLTQQQTGDLDKKVEEEIFSIKIRALVTSPDPNRPERVIEDLSRSFSQYSYIGLNAFKFKKAKDMQQFAKDFINRLFRNDN